MLFRMAMTVEGVPDLALKWVETKQHINYQAVLFCERWINKGGGQRGDPYTGRPIGMTIVQSDQSSAIFDFEIAGALRALQLVVTGRDADLDNTAGTKLQQLCQERRWPIEHKAYAIRGPMTYVVCQPLQDSPPELVVGLENLCDHLAAAVYNLRDLPV